MKQKSPRPLLLHFHDRLDGPFLLQLGNLRLTLLFPLGGRGSLLGYLRPLALLLPSWGWRAPPPGLHPGLLLGRESIRSRPVRSSMHK